MVAEAVGTTQRLQGCWIFPLPLTNVHALGPSFRLAQELVLDWPSAALLGGSRRYLRLLQWEKGHKGKASLA